MPETFRVSDPGTFRLNGGCWTVTPGTAQSGELKLFSIPIKEVSVTSVDRTTVTLGGTPFGLKLYTEGALIVGLDGSKQSRRRAAHPGKRRPRDDGGV